MVLSRSRLFCCGAFLLFALVFIALVKENSYGLICHYLIGKYVYSTSNGAALFFACYLFFLLFWNLFPATKKRFIPYSTQVFLLALFSGHVAGLFLTFSYFAEFHIPLATHVYHWSGESISYTSVVHSHLAKPSIQVLLKPVLNFKHTYDTGLALKNTFGHSVYLIISLCCLLSFVGAVVNSGKIFRRYEFNNAVILLYVLATAILLKNMLDGGLLAYDCLPSAIILFSLIKAPDRDSLIRWWLKPGWIISLALVLAYFILWAALFSAEKPFPSIGNLLFLGGTYVLLLLWMMGLLKRHPLLAGFILMWLCAHLWVDSRTNLFPLLARLSADSRVLMMTSTGVPESVSVRRMAGLPVWKVYRALGESPLKPQRTLVSNDRSLEDQGFYFILKILRTINNGGAIKPNKLFVVDKVRQLSADNLLFKIRIPGGFPRIFSEEEGDVLTRSNYYVYLHAVNRILQRSGIQEYIFTPLTQSNPLPLR